VSDREREKLIEELRLDDVRDVKAALAKIAVKSGDDKLKRAANRLIEYPIDDMHHRTDGRN
jgi:capsule polysaccharide export protein KpsE/RkpR